MFAYAKLTIFYDITYLLLHKLCDKGAIRLQYAKTKSGCPARWLDNHQSSLLWRNRDRYLLGLAIICSTVSGKPYSTLVNLIIGFHSFLCFSK